MTLAPNQAYHTSNNTEPIRPERRAALTAEGLFEHLFDGLEGWLATLTGHHTGALEDAKPGSYRYPHSARAAAHYLRHEARARQRDSFFGIHLYRRSGTRKAADALEVVRALWLDEDEGSWLEDGPQPTAIVHSSENRRHHYWRLTRPIPADEGVSLNRRIAALAGGDGSKAGLSSVLRVPGTFNFKRRPRVDAVRGYLTGAGPWEPEVLEQAIPPLPEPHPNPERKPYGGPPCARLELASWIAAAGVEVLEEVADEGGTKFAIVCPWVSEHTGGDDTGTYVGQYENGALWFFCNHAHCEGRGWQEFRAEVEPPEARKKRYVGRGKVYRLGGEVII